VAPQPLAQRFIRSPDAEGELARARAELESLHGPRALRRAPAELARAQARFDCWLQEQEEATQAGDIAACRDGFRAAVAAVREKSALGQDLFVVIEGDDGHVGAITVTSGEREVVLDRALAAAHVRGSTGLEAVDVAPEEVEALFSGALAAKPLPPASFALYFVTDSLQLTPDSEPVLEQVYRDIARRPVAEVTVIGHTDRVGRAAYNDELSRERAAEVRDFLIRKGIPAEMITTAGRGEREPLVATADGVAEARNRRAEISVR
jgi:OOP family OmpA-OmpF porin